MLKPSAIGPRVSIALLVLLAVIAGAFAIRPSTAPGENPPGAVSPLASTAPAASPVPSQFRPIVERAAREAATLVSLGDSRERNLFRIRAAQATMSAALADADAWLAAHPPAAADEAAVVSYRDGAASIREAMTEAQAGFVRLDFDRVARATETMREGEAALRHAIALLTP